MAARTRHGTAGMGLLTPAACATQDVPAPDAGSAVPPPWVETDVAPATLDLSAYWRLLDDPLLTEFVEASIANNLELAQAAARLDQARAQLRGARAAYVP